MHLMDDHRSACAELDPPPAQDLSANKPATATGPFSGGPAPGAPFSIGPFSIGEGQPVFVIAEIGLNHNGSPALARRLVDAAHQAGANCAKFQMRNLERLYVNGGDPDDAREDLGSQYVLDVLARAQLSTEAMIAIFDDCRNRGIMPLCTPWDTDSVATLEAYGMDAYKVASADLTNPELLAAVVATGKPLIVSTGMSTEEEICEAVELLTRSHARYALLHCVSTYPAPFADVNLKYLDRLERLGNCPVGYSGHERGFAIALAAVARGARVVEKHLTLDRSMAGNDHKVSLLPEEFAAMVRGIREIEAGLGSGGARRLGQGERMNRETLAKSLIAARPIEAGEVIRAEDVVVQSPGKGLQPNRRQQLVGRRANRAIPASGFFFASDLADGRTEPRCYKFRRPWGLAVRYHDFDQLRRLSNPDFLEFHLSFKDLEQPVERFLHGPYESGLVVHSPDHFAEDHLLNLAAEDEAHRARSVGELQRVIEVTRAIAAHFPNAAPPLLVVSVGGFTQDRPLPAEERPRLYERVARALARLDCDGVVIVPQTLPPFPWYFGGQLHCNLFVDADDTARFCRDYGLRVCLDVSHSKLAANHRRIPFAHFVEQVAPHAAHLHLVDAAGVDGEGLQIGEGEVDFPALARQLDRLAPAAGFIPEIWQGHKNRGEGFWCALERLERWF